MEIAEVYKPDSAFIVLVEVDLNAPVTSRIYVFSSVCNAQCWAYPWMTLSDEEVYRTSGLKTSF